MKFGRYKELWVATVVTERRYWRACWTALQQSPERSMTIESCRVAEMAKGEKHVEHEQLKLPSDSQGNAYRQHCIAMLDRVCVKSDKYIFETK